MPGAGAFSVHRVFEPAGPIDFRMERHYLLYALGGVMRLEAGGRRWTLPPARAALIRAGCPIRVEILSRLESASVLFTPGFMPPPAQELAVFDMSPLGRELVRECRGWTAEATALGRYERRIFATLAEVTLRLAATPVPCVLPAPRSPALVRALQLTEAQADAAPSFAAIARASGQSERALARRFRDELGMTWSELLRRIRIIRAVEALGRGEAQVAEIAAAVGYESLSAFNAAFRELMGTTPTRYRATLKG